MMAFKYDFHTFIMYLCGSSCWNMSLLFWKKRCLTVHHLSSNMLFSNYCPGAVQSHSFQPCFQQIILRGLPDNLFHYYLSAFALTREGFSTPSSTKLFIRLCFWGLKNLFVKFMYFFVRSQAYQICKPFISLASWAISTMLGVSDLPPPASGEVKHHVLTIQSNTEDLLVLSRKKWIDLSKMFLPSFGFAKQRHTG